MNINHQVELGLFDWEKAYCQIPTAINQWPFLIVQNFEGMILLDTRITFEGVAGCGSFGRPADAWKELMQQEFHIVHIFRWVDDNLFVRSVGANNKMEDIVRQSKQLGVKTNKSKYLEFGPSKKFIGFMWNGIKKTVGLPKKEEKINQIKLFLDPDRKFSMNDKMVLVGP